MGNIPGNILVSKIFYDSTLISYIFDRAPKIKTLGGFPVVVRISLHT